MAKVFISYARADENVAERAAEALLAGGHEVWRDDQLPAHRAYGDVIEERLAGADAVLVLWSATAIRSQWVRAEADTARQREVLVQASLDGSVPPLPFGQIHYADLGGWTGDADHSGWSKIERSIGELVPKVVPDDGTRTARRDRPAVCVLPFQNMSGDSEQEYFSDGISEDITTDLSKISALAVTARNTAFTFRGSAVDVCEIARKLGVSHVLEGSVRKAGGRVRITAQLIDGGSGDHVWAERYDRELTDIFAIQDEISKAIVDALKLKLLPEEKEAIEQRGTTNAEAYNLYLMARQYWITGNYGDIRRDERVVRLCQRIVELDPNYARAWALMALTQANLYLYFGKRDETGLAAAERALELDPNIAEAHCVKARHFSDAGNTNEADREIAIALQLDPDSWEVNDEAARQCMVQRRLTEATRYYEKAASLMETDFHSWGILITCYRARGDQDNVLYAAKVLVEKCEQALREDPSNGSALGMIAAGLALIGEKERAKEWIGRALLLDPDNSNSRYNFACVLANELDEKEEAIALLKPWSDKVSGDLIEYAEADPDFDSIRDDPRFQAMIANAKARIAKSRLRAAPVGASPAASSGQPRS